MSENNFELVKRELSTDPAQGAILARVLQNLSPAEIERLKNKAAEGKMAIELEQISKAHQFEASSADIEQFIQNVRMLEMSQRNKFSTYKTSGTFKTATGTTTIEAKKGCFVATQVYGDRMHPNVVLLRDFKDKWLEQNGCGKRLCCIYYHFGPYIAASPFGRGQSARVIRKVLDLLCRVLSK